VSLVVHYREDLPLEGGSEGDYLLAFGHTRLLQHGYWDQRVELWSEDERLLAEAHHLIAYLASRPTGGDG
jgi:hypothetical protein